MTIYILLPIYNRSLSISKTNVLLFNIRNKNRNINLYLNIIKIKVKYVSEIKLSGVIIDCQLNWKLQLNYVSSKLSVQFYTKLKIN